MTDSSTVHLGLDPGAHMVVTRAARWLPAGGRLAVRGKTAFLERARALIFPIDWPEPLGLAVIEALACGTPAICRRRGAVPAPCSSVASTWSV